MTDKKDKKESKTKKKTETPKGKIKVKAKSKVEAKEKTPTKKKLAEKKSVKKEKTTTTTVSEKYKEYYEAVGRRKTAAARVRIFPQGGKEILINNNSYKDYFPTVESKEIAVASLKSMNCFEKFKVTVVVRGGGKKAQAEAVRHGIARALIEFNPDFRKRLSRAGYLTRDPRMRERKKFGLKRARKAAQWSKR